MLVLEQLWNILLVLWFHSLRPVRCERAARNTWSIPAPKMKYSPQGEGEAGWTHLWSRCVALPESQDPRPHGPDCPRPQLGVTPNHNSLAPWLPALDRWGEFGFGDSTVDSEHLP